MSRKASDMENGKIMETGTHESLMTLGKGYAKLYGTQKSLENGGIA